MPPLFGGLPPSRQPFLSRNGGANDPFSAKIPTSTRYTRKWRLRCPGGRIRAPRRGGRRAAAGPAPGSSRRPASRRWRRRLPHGKPAPFGERRADDAKEERCVPQPRRIGASRFRAVRPDGGGRARLGRADRDRADCAFIRLGAPRCRGAAPFPTGRLRLRLARAGRTAAAVAALFYLDAVDTLLDRGAGAGLRGRGGAGRGAAIDAGMAGASLTLDATVEMITQMLFTASGIALFLATAPDPRMPGWSLPALAIAGLAVLLFIAAQRRGGLKLVERGLAQLARKWPRLARLAEARLHDCLIRLYRGRRAALIAASYHFGAWLLGAGEIWLVLVAIGHRLPLAACVTVESLSMAARSAGFFIPGGLGAQEGGLIMAGSLVGLPPESALAIAVLKRLRDVAVGMPGLVAWLWTEGRHAPPAAPAHAPFTFPPPAAGQPESSAGQAGRGPRPQGSQAR